MQLRPKIPRSDKPSAGVHNLYALTDGSSDISMGALVVVRRSRIVQCALSDARNTVIATRASDDVRSLQLLNTWTGHAVSFWRA